MANPTDLEGMARYGIATDLAYDGGDGAAAEIEGRELLIAVRRR